jgi:hypothetical protein
MRDAVRESLLAMAAEDRRTRDRLAADGSLYRGYHREMQAVHDANARALEALVATHGWPTPELAGEDGAEAAWLIVQHAIGLPAFQRACLALLEAAAEQGAVPRRQPAMLGDRIRALEGKPQRYGTQFDWDADGLMSPLPIEDPEHVDERRAAVGLSPLQDATARHRAEIGPEARPADFATREREKDAWARRTGWR